MRRPQLGARRGTSSLAAERTVEKKGDKLSKEENVCNKRLWMIEGGGRKVYPREARAAGRGRKRSYRRERKDRGLRTPTKEIADLKETLGLALRHVTVTSVSSSLRRRPSTAL